jgi:biopolymer transport protein ExbD
MPVYSKRDQGQAGAVSMNMTPMIDCTFQLIIFFILATRFASDQVKPMQLHRPLESKAVESEVLAAREGPTTHTIINVVSKVPKDVEAVSSQASVAEEYWIAGYDPVEVGREEQLADILRKELAKAKEQGATEKTFFVDIRADKRVGFAYVEPVISAAADAKIPKMNITALTPE